MREAAIPLPPTLAAIIGTPKAPLSTIYAVRDQLIAELDQIDGDTDLEEMDAEDSFILSHLARCFADRGPGCPIADTDYAVDDLGCDGDEGV